MPAPDDRFGVDVSTFLEGDLDPYFRLISGARVVAEAIVRRWTTPTGGLFFDESFGVDIRELASKAMTPQTLFALASTLAAQAEEDERVQSALVNVSFSAATKRLLVRAEIRCATGPFTLVVSADRLSVELLEPK
ncbi:MAG: hypothetical protein ACXVEF_32855 [Polyangiales bacterium]